MVVVCGCRFAILVGGCYWWVCGYCDILCWRVCDCTCVKHLSGCVTVCCLVWVFVCLLCLFRRWLDLECVVGFVGVWGCCFVGLSCWLFVWL